jgi:polysaccharide deacetylase family protein (PEP-CTERM system associated)
MVSVFSVDVEDWFHILNLPSGHGMSEWDSLPSRVETNFRRLLDLFSRNDVRVTCFFLGWVAERFPNLVRQASDLGHEVASHGYSHSLVYTMSSEEFLADIQRSKDILEGITGQRVLGYRAPGYSVTEKTPWFYEKVAEAGYRYDSSIFPTRRGHGGLAGTFCAPHTISVGSSNTLIEFPISVAEFLTARFCVFGGGYLRVFPWSLIKFMANRVTKQGRPVTFYLHPREIDPEHPRLPMNPLRTFKCYVNVKSTERKVESILKEFPLTTFQQFLADHESQLAGASEPANIGLARVQSGGPI